MIGTEFGYFPNNLIEEEMGMVDDAANPEVAVRVDEADLAKVRAMADAKMMRHRLDDYLSVILGVGAALLLWILQFLDVY